MPDIKKIQSPTLGQVVLLPRLAGVLAAALKHGAAWLHGPAGCGKTTLAAAFLRESGIPHAWYRVDGDEDDPAACFHYLTLALAKNGAIPAGALPTWPAEANADPIKFAHQFFRQAFARLPASFVIVLDGCQAVQPSSPFWQILRCGLAECPAGKALLFLGRLAPPPAFSQAIAEGRMIHPAAREFRLSDEESGALLRAAFPGLDGVHGQAAVDGAGGWIMGLRLLAGAIPGNSGHMIELLHDYLDTEVYGQLSVDDQVLLAELALLPEFSAQQALVLTDRQTARQRLALLEQQCFFIESVTRQQGEQLHRFQPLFREFLLARPCRHIPPQRLDELARRVPAMADSVEGESALVDLLAGRELWPRLAAYIAARADKLLAMGQGTLLADWLRRIPNDVIAADAWLSHAQGQYLAAQSQPAQAYQYYRHAWENLKTSGDADARALAWAGAVDTLYRGLRNLAELDEWIAEAETMFPEGKPPPGEVGRRVAQCGLVPLFLRQPAHPFLAQWATVLEGVIHDRQGWDEQMAAAAPLVRYMAWHGGGTKARALIESIPPPPDDANVAGKALWHTVRTMCCLHGGNYGTALYHVQSALDMLPPAAAPLLKWRILLCGGYAALENGDCARAWEFFEAIARIRSPATPFDEAQYHFIGGWAALLDGKYATARTRFDEALGILRDSNIRWGTAFAHASLVHTLLALGYRREARVHLSQAQQVIGNSGSRLLDHFIAMTQAWYEIESSDEQAGLIHLEKAFAMARKEDYLSTPWLTHAFLERMCLHAIRHGIEVPFVRRIIREKGFTPDCAPLDIPDWPWPIRVYTLGRFSLLKDDQPLPFTAKGHGKPLELLKLVIALGGSDIGKQGLIEALWPRLDGDFAEKAFNTALYRLRKLIGNERALLVHGGSVSINRDVVWIDAWALEHALVRRPPPDTLEPDRLVPRLEEIMALYQGDFLGTDAALPQIERKRAQLRKEFRDGIIETASNLVAAGHAKQAAVIYGRVLAHLPNMPEIQQRLEALSRHRRRTQ